MVSEDCWQLSPEGATCWDVSRLHSQPYLVLGFCTISASCYWLGWPLPERLCQQGVLETSRAEEKGPIQSCVCKASVLFCLKVSFSPAWP